MRTDGSQWPFWLLLTVVLGIPGGVALQHAPTAQPTSKPAGAETAPANLGPDTGSTPDASLAQRVNAGFASEGLTRPTPLPDPGCPARLAHPLELSIGLLPDPEKTRLGLTFDQRLSALQEAFATDHWRLAQFALPWKAKSDEHPITSNFLTPTRVGMLLFRRPIPLEAQGALSLEPRYHLQLLVGESPTLGVDRAGFHAALQEFQRLAACASPDDRTRLRLVGPGFSGSAVSLGQLLGASGYRSAHIESPSASDPRLAEILRLQARVGAELAGLSAPTIHFQTHILTSQRLNQMINGHFGQDAPIAWFLESRTDFADSITREKDAGTPVSCSRSPPGTSDGQPCIRYYRYPFGIAQVRQEQNQRAKAVARDNDAIPVAQHRLLSLYQQDAGAPEDSIGPLSLYTSRTIELFLADLITSLRDDGYTHIGITGTNPNDVIFMTELIRNYHPDATVFTTSSGDMLFAHPDNARGTEGLILFGGYPVSAPMRRASHGEVATSTYLYSSEAEYGSFFATLAMIRRDSDEQRALRRLEPGIALVSHGRLWPIALHADDSAALTLTLSAFGLVLAAALWLLVRRLRPGATAAWPAAALAHARSYEILAVFAALVLATVVIVLLAGEYWSEPTPGLVRFLGLAPGVSLAPPLVLLAAGTLGYALCQLYLMRRLVVLPDWRALAHGTRELEAGALAVGEELGRSWRLPLGPGNRDALAWITTGLGLGFLVAGVLTVRPLAETPAVGRAVVVAGSLLALLAVISFLRFWRSWQRLRAVLERLNLRLGPEEFKNLFPCVTHVLTTLRRERRYAWVAQQILDAAGDQTPQARADLARLQAPERRVFSADSLRAETRLQQHLAGMAQDTSEPRLRELLAAQLIARCLSAFRMQLFASLGGLLAVLLALMGFAFQPKSLFATVVWVSILSICALVAGALVQMERDTIISRLTNRPEGEVKFDSEFVQLLLRYVLLPLLLVATTQVPALADLIQDYLNPLMRLVR